MGPIEPNRIRTLLLTLLTASVLVATASPCLAQDPTGRPSPARRPPRRAPTRTEPPPITVILTILSDPPECDVTINGEHRGTTNAEGKLQIEKLPLAHYTVEVAKKQYRSQVKGFEAGSESPTLVFKLEPDIDDDIKEFDSLIEAGKLTGPDTPAASEVLDRLANKFPDRPEIQRMKGVLAAKLVERVNPVVTRTLNKWRSLTVAEVGAALDAAINAGNLRSEDNRIQAMIAYLRGVRAFRNWQTVQLHRGGAEGPSPAQAESGQGDYLAEARAEFEKAIKADESWMPARYGYGLVLLNNDDAAGAEAVFQTVVKLEPRWSPGYASLGSACYASGKFKESLEAYGKAVELDANSVAAVAGLGLAKASNGDLKDGLKDLERAKQIDATSGLPHFYIGTIYSRSKKSKEINLAKEELKRAIEKNSANLEFQNGAAEKVLAELNTRKR
jgi:tetratricopeptide (TPR) repeat protein